MKIGIDCDDVLLDSYTSLNAYHNHHYGTSHRREDIRSWLIEHTWGCTPEEALVRVEAWYDTLWHSQTGPMPGALAAVAKLAEHHELHMITGRPGRVEEITRRLVLEHFPGIFAAMHFSNHFKANARSKGHICRDLGIAVMIEDSLGHARAVAASGVPVLLFDSPWNQEPVNGLITRVSGWDDVLQRMNLSG